MSQLTDSLNQIKTWLEDNCPLDYQIVEPLIIALKDEDKRVKSLARWGLEELEYKFN
jgi:hypothetical protein